MLAGEALGHQAGLLPYRELLASAGWRPRFLFLNPRRPPPKQSGWGSEVIETSYRTFEKLATLANVFVKVLPLISIIIVKLVVCNDSGHAYAHCCASIAARLLRCEYC